VKEEAKISKTFCGTHFLTLRYLKLFEIIPGPQTSSEVLDFTIYGEKFLERLQLLLKILQFIGNRIGIYGIQMKPRTKNAQRHRQLSLSRYHHKQSG
jgi:3-hydroxyacyl-CoA dehydrogenase